jgi:hypothetical protein
VADKTLLIKLKTTHDGQTVISGFVRSLDDVSGAENRLQSEMAQTAAAARAQDSALSGATSTLKGWITAAGSAIAIGATIKKVFDYHEDVESTTNSIAGLYFANKIYTDSAGKAVDETTAWQAALAEAGASMSQLQLESLKTAATVPQIGTAYATTYGAIMAAGLKATDAEILQLTVRLTQAANAFEVPMEQMRQEINSLVTGQVTEDSVVAKRLGLDNKSIKKLQANGTFVTDVIKRTDAYAKAAEAQSNTVRGKITNTVEAVIATLSRSFDSVIQRSKGGLDLISDFVQRNGTMITEWTQRVISGVTSAVDLVSRWVAENGEVVGSMVAIAGAAILVSQGINLIAVAYAIATGAASRFMLTALAIVVVWEGLRKLAPIEVGGSTVGGYFSAFATGLFGLLGTFVASLKSVLTIVGAGLRFLVADLFNSLGWGVRKLGEALHNDTIAQMGKSVEDFWAPWAAGSGNLTAVFNREVDAAAEMAQATIDGTKAAFQGTKDLPSIAAMAGDALAAALDKVKGLFPEAQKTGDELAKKLMGGITGIAKPTAPKVGDGKADKKLEDAKAKYLDFMEEFRSSAAASGNALNETLAKIVVDRDEAVRKFYAFQKAGVPTTEADLAAIRATFDDKMVDASANALKRVNDQTLRETRTLYDLTTSIAADAQKRVSDRKLSLIRNEIERTKQTRLAENRFWLKEQLADIGRSVENGLAKEKAMETVRAEFRQRNVEAETDAQEEIRQQNEVTSDHYAQLAEALRTQFRSIGQIIIDSVVDARAVVATSLNGFLDDILEGQADLFKSLSDLSKNLARIWTKNLTDILLSGRNVMGQLKELFKNIRVTNAAGETDFLGTGLQGAGLGGAVGSLFQGPNNYAGVGGSVGGGIGAALGAAIAGYFTGGLGAGAGAQIGAVIGTVIGTAIGSVIQKGKDQIRVAIVNGVATVTETGISATARSEVQTQIQRRVHDEIKGWQGIFDLLPDAIKAELARLHMLNPSINLSGGIENADITDEGALDTLSNFLGNDLPSAVFGAYQSGLGRGLALLGVGSQRLTQLFAYWGTLQGKELQDAVRTYVVTLLEAIDVRDKFTAPFETRLAEAKSRSSSTALGQIDDLDAKLQMAVASMAKLTDVDDLVGAQQEINRLASQRYEMEIQYLQRIDAIATSLRNSIAGQKEQLQVSGMDDQGKVDFFFKRMLQLRGQLASASDPEEINRLTQQIQGYVSQASGVAPDNAEMRAKLIAILDDVDNISQGKLQQAIKDVEARDMKPAEALTKAAEMLQKAAIDLTTPPSTPRDPSVPLPRPPDGPPKPGRPDVGNGSGMTPNALGSSIAPPRDASLSIADAMARTIALFDLRAERERDLALKHAAALPPGMGLPTARDFGAAVHDALQGMQFTMTVPIQAGLDENDVRYIEARVVATLKANGNITTPRT